MKTMKFGETSELRCPDIREATITWKIQPVCKTCYYRRMINTGGYATGNWESSMCDYVGITGKLRGCYPDGGNCDCYRAREQTPQKSLGFTLK